jgi:hypothetical protein
MHGGCLAPPPHIYHTYAIVCISFFAKTIVCISSAVILEVSKKENYRKLYTYNFHGGVGCPDPHSTV